MTITGPWRRTAAGAGLLDTGGAIRPTIFAEMTALAAETGAINLGQGFPDEDGPAEVVEAAREAIAAGVNQYPPGRGMAVLREAIAAHQGRFYGIGADPETEVLVTAGATEAIAATLLALLEPGDELLTLEPFYDEYGAIAALAGAQHRTVRLRWPDFTPDPKEFAAAVTDRTRIILLNNPHNPCGTVLSADFLRVVVEAAERHDAIIVTDEVYEHLTFGVPHVPVASLPGAAGRTVTISSGGKTFSATGWKIGWAIARPELIEAILAVKQFLTYVNGAPFQPAIAAGLALPRERFDAFAAELGAKRDLLRGALLEAGFPVSRPDGSYFLIADAAALGYEDAATLCRALPALAGVVAVPVTAFCSPEHAPEYGSLLRFAYCKRRDVLEEAAHRLAAARS